MSDLCSFQQRDIFEIKRNIYLKAVEFVVKRMLRGSISSTYGRSYHRILTELLINEINPVSKRKNVHRSKAVHIHLFV